MTLHKKINSQISNETVNVLKTFKISGNFRRELSNGLFPFPVVLLNYEWPLLTFDLWSNIQSVNVTAGSSFCARLVFVYDSLTEIRRTRTVVPRPYLTTSPLVKPPQCDVLCNNVSDKAYWLPEPCGRLLPCLSSRWDVYRFAASYKYCTSNLQLLLGHFVTWMQDSRKWQFWPNFFCKNDAIVSWRKYTQNFF